MERKKERKKERSDVPHFIAYKSSILIWDRVYLYTRIKVQYKYKMYTVHNNKIEFVNKHLHKGHDRSKQKIDQMKLGMLSVGDS